MKRHGSYRKYVLAVAVSLALFVIYQWASIYRDFAIIDAQRQNLEDRLIEKRRELSDLQLELRAREMDIARFNSHIQDLRRRGNVRRTLMLEDRRLQKANQTLPEIYVITPTSTKPTQRADMTRLAQTLMHVPRLWWIVVEDAEAPSSSLNNLLKTFDLRYSHIATLTPAPYRRNASTDPRWYKPRGVAQRNLGLRWLRRNVGLRSLNPEPVVYFADDDNTYHWKLFEEIRQTRKVGVWPVGLSGKYMVERAIVDESGRIQRFLAWAPERPFPMDMAGFAVNYRLIREKNPTFIYDLPPGGQESYFLNQIVTRDDLEPLASKCTQVLVWHTQTMVPRLDNELQLRKTGFRSDDGIDV